MRSDYTEEKADLSFLMEISDLMAKHLTKNEEIGDKNYGNP